MVGEDSMTRYFPRQSVNIDSPTQLLTGYHLAVDSLRCRVYYVRTNLKDSVDRWINTFIGRIDVSIAFNLAYTRSNH